MVKVVEKFKFRIVSRMFWCFKRQKYFLHNKLRKCWNTRGTLFSEWCLKMHIVETTFTLSFKVWQVYVGCLEQDFWIHNMYYFLMWTWITLYLRPRTSMASCCVEPSVWCPTVVPLSYFTHSMTNYPNTIHKPRFQIHEQPSCLIPAQLNGQNMDITIQNVLNNTWKYLGPILGTTSPLQKAPFA